jgi:16S rRNA (uracil1498-N3)-methyltransferase
MPPRFFVAGPLIPGEVLALPPDVVRHLHVLRHQAEAPITLFDGTGGEREAAIVELGKQRAMARIESSNAREAEPPYRLTLAQGVAGGDKMDWLIEKAVELGAFAVVPVTTVRSVVRLSAERALKRQQHWQALVRAACEQCGRNRVPDVALPVGFAAFVAALDPAPALRLLLSPRAAKPFAELPARAPDCPVTILIGPEGGLSEEEETLARSAGFEAVALGPRVLRTETAGIALLAALAGRWGGW